MKSGSAIVLLSGGQDSTTCLYWALQRYEHVQALTFLYGQRHRSELGAAARVASRAGVPHDVQEIPHLRGSALTSSEVAIRADGGRGDAQAPGGLPTSYVPGRNLVLLSLAVAVAGARGVGTVVIGVSQADYSGYPDCRGEFLDAFRAAAVLALPSAEPVAIEAPLLDLTKEATVRLAAKLPGCWAALADTITCYQGQHGGCGACPACELRARGFAEAGLLDPARPIPAIHPSRYCPRCDEVGHDCKMVQDAVRAGEDPKRWPR